MKYLKQSAVILAVTLLGELTAYVLPFSVPASIYGLVELLLLLSLKIIKPHQIKETADFLIEIMPIMFIPASVGVMKSYLEFKSIIAQILTITLFSTFVVMSVSSLTTQFVIRRSHKKEDGKR